MNLSRSCGARIAVVNMDGEAAAKELGRRDFLFVGEVAQVLPELVESVVGQVKVKEEVEVKKEEEEVVVEVKKVKKEE